VNDEEIQAALRKRADLTFAGLLALGVIVSALVTVMTGNLALSLLYGLAPGVALGVLGRRRILRGGSLTRQSTTGSEDRERA
jgi:hypothetical protein